MRSNLSGWSLVSALHSTLILGSDGLQTSPYNELWQVFIPSLVFLSPPVIQVLPEPGVILNWIVESFVTFSMFFKKYFNLHARGKVSLVSLKSPFKNG